MVKHYGTNNKYDEYGTCPICNSANELSNTHGDEWGMHECKTKCEKCGHENYWAYGNFVQPYEELDKQMEEMKLSDIKVGDIFTIGNTPSYPKRRTDNGYIDMRDNIVKVIDDLPHNIRLLTNEELKEIN